MIWPDALGVSTHNRGRYTYYTVFRFIPRFLKSRKKWAYQKSVPVCQSTSTYGRKLDDIIAQAELDTGLVCLRKSSLHNVLIKDAWVGREEQLIQLFSKLNKDVQHE